MNAIALLPSIISCPAAMVSSDRSDVPYVVGVRDFAERGITSNRTRHNALVRLEITFATVDHRRWPQAHYDIKYEHSGGEDAFFGKR